MKPALANRLSPALVRATTHASAFADFHRGVVADPALFAQLRVASDPDEFAALAVRLGAARGQVFTEDDVRAGLREARRSWIERNLA